MTTKVVKVVTRGFQGAKGDSGGALPDGGEVGQVLVKTGEEDQAATWEDAPTGVDAGQVRGIIRDATSTQNGVLTGLASTVEIMHDMGDNPIILCKDSEGRTIYPVIEEVSSGIVLIHTSIPITGTYSIRKRVTTLE